MDPKTNFHGVRGNVIFHYGLVDKPKVAVDTALEKLGFILRTDSSYLLSGLAPYMMKDISSNFGPGGSATHSKLCNYSRGAKPSQAPGVVDCSSFTQWLYASIGVEAPRLSIEQYEMGSPVDLNDLQTGDLIFKAGKMDYFMSEREAGIGHVGIIVKHNAGEVSIYHAVPEKGIVRSPLKRFYKGPPDDPRFRGVRRIVPRLEEWVTLRVPDPLIEVVKTTQNVRWRVLTSLE